VARSTRSGKDGFVLVRRKSTAERKGNVYLSRCGCDVQLFTCSRGDINAAGATPTLVDGGDLVK
jgi:hypothetical protein